jgi:hypothetical protein
MEKDIDPEAGGRNPSPEALRKDLPVRLTDQIMQNSKCDQPVRLNATEAETRLGSVGRLSASSERDGKRRTKKGAAERKKETGNERQGSREKAGCGIISSSC